MIIALDYDGTITTNVEFWLDFIKKSEAAGYEVVIATMRYVHEQATMDPRVLQACHWIVCTGRKAKRAFLERVGIVVSIWIDDQPHFILQDATDPPTFKHDDSGLHRVLDMIYGNPLQSRWAIIYRSDEAKAILEKECYDAHHIACIEELSSVRTFNNLFRATLLIHERFFARIVDMIDWDDVHLLSTTALQKVEYELAMKHIPSAINTGITLDPNEEVENAGSGKD